MSTYLLEICAGNLQSAVNAAQAGAARIELCAALSEGGLTPSYGLLKVCRAAVGKTKLNVLIRPRGGDFVYSRAELDIMLQDIAVAKCLGADGLVLGCLNADGTLDIPALQELLAAAAPLPVTFHRAFDHCRDPQDALMQLIKLPVARVLTSGQASSALQGTALIAKLQAVAQGRICIMPGAGISADNLAAVAAATGCREFHMSAKTRVGSAMRLRHNSPIVGGSCQIDDYDIDISDPSAIQAALAVLQTLPDAAP